MAQPTPTFFDELKAAARGCFALLVGNNQAPSYFDFSQRGLVGSFIALVISLAVQAFGPALVGHSTDAGVSSGAVILGAMLFATQFGVSWVILRALGRSDGFIPFLVALNWTAFFEAFFAVAVVGIFGEPFTLLPDGQTVELDSGALPLMVLAVGMLILAVNIARLVVTLRPAHVALFVGAQLLTALVSPFILGSLF